MERRNPCSPTFVGRPLPETQKRCSSSEVQHHIAHNSHTSERGASDRRKGPRGAGRQYIKAESAEDPSPGTHKGCRRRQRVLPLKALLGGRRCASGSARQKRRRRRANLRPVDGARDGVYLRGASIDAAVSPVRYLDSPIGRLIMAARRV
ncbi:Protein of unknown function [Gryllus bimaculatus]|nr:Protein of unknown function [Gryllus bimaculatus]